MPQWLTCVFQLASRHFNGKHKITPSASPFPWCQHPCCSCVMEKRWGKENETFGGVILFCSFSTVDAIAGTSRHHIADFIHHNHQHIIWLCFFALCCFSSTCWSVFYKVIPMSCSPTLHNWSTPDKWCCQFQESQNWTEACALHGHLFAFSSIAAAMVCLRWDKCNAFFVPYLKATTQSWSFTTTNICRCIWLSLHLSRWAPRLWRLFGLGPSVASQTSWQTNSRHHMCCTKLARQDRF